MHQHENAVHLDCETYSALDLRKVGGYRYARDESTEVLILCYWGPGMDAGLDEPCVWLPWCEPLPDDLRRLANDPAIDFYAHNAQFERALWRYTLPRTVSVPWIEARRWKCTAFLAASNGLARSLGLALRMLDPNGQQKNPDGEDLIKVFCKPRKPTKANPSTRVLPQDNPEAFKRFIRYCQDDVLGEVALAEGLPPVHPVEDHFYTLDLLMNERGLPVDLPLVRKAHATLQRLEADIRTRVEKITGGIRATQRQKMIDVFASMGLDLEDLQAGTVRDVLAAGDDLPPVVRELLALRVEAGKAGTKKLAAMLHCTHPVDHVIQGAFLINGAHTGRYAGRLVQPQNFLRGNLKPDDRAIVFDLLDKHGPDLLSAFFEWPITTIGQCMRGFIRAPAGYEFAVVDYAAIEARVLAWVAGDPVLVQAFRDGVDVYKRMASLLFGVTIDAVTPEQRQIGKNLVLGCGYGLGGASFVDYCAGLGVAIEVEFAKKAVKVYRNGHPLIVKLWARVEAACVAVLTGQARSVSVGKCKVYRFEKWLTVELPSGRCLRYLRMRATPCERWGKPAHSLTFDTDYKGRLSRENTYGGKLVENIVQAIARDVMRDGMMAADREGFEVVGTVHDELITLRPEGDARIHDLENLVCDEVGEWAEGLPLKAEGFVCMRYGKG